MRVERLDLSEWGRALPKTGFEVFHTPEALGVLDDHTDADMRLFGGFKGQQPVALLAVFVARKALGTAVLSPPPSMGVPRLGPLVMPNSPKRRKQEQINRTFTTEVLDRVFDEEGDARRPGVGDRPSLSERVPDAVTSSLSMFRAVCSPHYGDPRPYVWEEFAVEPTFTYVLDVGSSSPDDLLSSFSKSLRREIRDGRELDLDVTVEGVDGARAVYEDTVARYDEQDRGFEMEWSYVGDLVDALDDRCRVYVAREPDGTYVSGITVLYSNDVAYFWQGGTRATYDGVSVNSFLHWRIIEDVADDPPVESVSAYDLMGANTERLCRYKAKFGADLRPYYTIESKNVGMNVAKRVYAMLHH